MQIRRSFGLRFILAIAGFSACANAAKAALSYQFTPGSRVAYEVNITGDLANTTENYTGHFFYTIKSFDPDTGQATIDFVARLAAKIKLQGTSTFIGPVIFDGSTYPSPRHIVVNQSGVVVKNDGEDQLPFMLAFTWALPLEHSPRPAEQQWHVHNTIELFDLANRSRMMPMFMRQRTNRTAEENVEYKILRTTPHEIVIAKKYEVIANEKLDGMPTLQQTGSGQIVFDKSTGWLKSMDMQMQIVTHENHASMTTPTSVHLQLLSPNASKLAWDQQQAAQVAAAKAQAERERPKLLDDNALNDALAKLKSVDSFRIQAGCETLEHAIVVKTRQSEVAAALESLLQNTDSFVRVASAKALAVWADSKNIPALESALSSGDVFLKQSAMDALAHFPSRSVADEVAKQLRDMSVRMQAENALIKMGPIAESSVLPLLKNVQWDVRLSACKILAAIGTQQSIPALQDLSGAEHNSLVNTNADRAVDAIRSRMK